MITGEDTPSADRKWAIEYWSNRVEGTPVSRSLMGIHQTKLTIPEDWDSLPLLERQRFVQGIESSATLELGDGSEDDED
jgi:hypothetical protein